jgi:hypothetical protein
VSSESVALGILFVIHALGLVVLFVALMRGDGGGGGWRDWWPRDDDDRPRDPGPPLPGARQSPVRMREPGRLADAHRSPARRPQHAPAAPRRTPERV